MLRSGNTRKIVASTRNPASPDDNPSAGPQPLTAHVPHVQVASATKPRGRSGSVGPPGYPGRPGQMGSRDLAWCGCEPALGPTFDRGPPGRSRQMGPAAESARPGAFRPMRTRVSDGRGAGACLVWRPLLLTLFEVGRLGNTAPLGWHSSAWARVSAPQERAAEQGVAMPQSSVRLHSRLEALSCVPSIGGCSNACGLRRTDSRGSASLAPCVTPCVCHLEMGAHPYRAGMFPMLNRFQVVWGLGEHRPFGL